MFFLFFSFSFFKVVQLYLTMTFIPHKKASLSSFIKCYKKHLRREKTNFNSVHDKWKF